MKNLLSLFAFILLTSQLQAQKGQSFGDKIDDKGAVGPSEFLEKIGNADSVQIKLKATVQEVCQKKGCWMNVDLGNEQSMMVRFKDYGFFVPKDCDGKIAVMDGVAFREVLSVEMLRHYAEDAGKSKEEIESITKPETRLSFEANGVLLYADKK